MPPDSLPGLSVGLRILQFPSRVELARLEISINYICFGLYFEAAKRFICMVLWCRGLAVLSYS
ncbi:MAG: hypothetical protein QXE79_08055 [Candidatus Bathyarchaeia archaeon]